MSGRECHAAIFATDPVCSGNRTLMWFIWNEWNILLPVKGPGIGSGSTGSITEFSKLRDCILEKTFLMQVNIYDYKTYGNEQELFFYFVSHIVRMKTGLCSINSYLNCCRGLVKEVVAVLVLTRMMEFSLKMSGKWHQKINWWTTSRTVTVFMPICTSRVSNNVKQRSLNPTVCSHGDRSLVLLVKKMLPGGATNTTPRGNEFKKL